MVSKPVRLITNYVASKKVKVFRHFHLPYMPKEVRKHADDYKVIRNK